MDRPPRPLSRRQRQRQRASAADRHRLRVAAVRRKQPDIERFVAALLALALADLDTERRPATGGDGPGEQSSGR